MILPDGTDDAWPRPERIRDLHSDGLEGSRVSDHSFAILNEREHIQLNFVTLSLVKIETLN